MRPVTWFGAASRISARGICTVRSPSLPVPTAQMPGCKKNLLLSPHAEIDAQPVLGIYADEVASHGATVGQLDARAVYLRRAAYRLRSRAAC
jgi:Fe-S cluster assembly scaffold protein SufB